MSKVPFYIFSPPFRETSAGIRVLHKLADELKKKKQDVYLYWLPNKDRKINEIVNFNLPFLDQNVINKYNRKKINPIIIFPEVFDENIFIGGIKIKYLLSYKKLNKKNNSYLLAFSKNIFLNLTKNQKKKCISILPLLDIKNNFFLNYKKIKKKRNLITYYSQKFEQNYGQKIPSSFKNFIRITNSSYNSLNLYQIKKLFLSSKVFFCFEESALAHEAMMCGCKVVFIKSDYFKKETILSKELGSKLFKYEDISMATNKKFISKSKTFSKNVYSKFMYNLKKLNKLDQKKLHKFILDIKKLSINKKFVPFMLHLIVSQIKSIFINKKLREIKLLLYFDYILNTIYFFGVKNFIYRIYKRLLYLRFKNI